MVFIFCWQYYIIHKPKHYNFSCFILRMCFKVWGSVSSLQLFIQFAYCSLCVLRVAASLMSDFFIYFCNFCCFFHVYYYCSNIANIIYLFQHLALISLSISKSVTHYSFLTLFPSKSYCTGVPFIFFWSILLLNASCVPGFSLYFQVTYVQKHESNGLFLLKKKLVNNISIVNI